MYIYTHLYIYICVCVCVVYMLHVVSFVYVYVYVYTCVRQCRLREASSPKSLVWTALPLHGKGATQQSPKWTALIYAHVLQNHWHGQLCLCMALGCHMQLLQNHWYGQHCQLQLPCFRKSPTQTAMSLSLSLICVGIHICLYYICPYIFGLMGTPGPPLMDFPDSMEASSLNVVSVAYLGP